MARTTAVSDTHTVRDQGKGLTFNASKFDFPKEGEAAKRRLSITADTTDDSWSILTLLPKSDALKSIIRRSAQSRSWRIFVPEISAQRVVIGFHHDVKEADAYAFAEEIGFTRNQPKATAKRSRPAKRAQR